MKRIGLVVAYDGTNYCGWQVQPNGVSIQSTLQKAIENLLGEKTDVTGASRTDSGVHALGQVAVFDTDKNIPDWKYALAINQRLWIFIPAIRMWRKHMNTGFLIGGLSCRKSVYTVILSRKS